MDWWKDKDLQELAIPVFPLPSTVHFPGTLLPLHVFEPRYRALVKDTLAKDARIGIALLKPGFEAEYHKNPPLYPMVCASRVIAHKELADGRYHILVEGLRRVNLLEELPQEDTYRVFQAHFPEEVSIKPPSREKEKVSTLLACVRRMINDFPEAAEAGKEIFKLSQKPGLLADVVSSIFVTDPQIRQNLLETLEIEKRLHQTTEVVGELILRLEKSNNSSLPIN